MIGKGRAKVSKGRSQSRQTGSVLWSCPQARNLASAEAAHPRTVAAALSAAVTSTNSQESTPTSQAEPTKQKHTPPNASRSSGGSAREGLLSEEAASLAYPPVRFHSSGGGPGEALLLEKRPPRSLPPPASLEKGARGRGLFYRKVLSLAVLLPFSVSFVILDGRGMGMRSKRERFLKAAERLNAVRCRCCGGRMMWRGDCFACEAGHTQDVNRKGYVNCLTRPHPTSYDQALFDARRQVFGAGCYAEVCAAIEALLPQGTHRLLDAGCGEGYYLNTLLSAHPDWQGAWCGHQPRGHRACHRSALRGAVVRGRSGQSALS